MDTWFMAKARLQSSGESNLVSSVQIENMYNSMTYQVNSKV